MILYKTEEEIELLKLSNFLVSRTHAEIAPRIKPGVKSIELDKIAEEFIRDNGGVPAFKGYSGFPNTLCVSPNEQVVHGFPNEKELKDGDIISVDCGVFMNDFHGDSAYTFEVGEVKPEIKQLLKVTKECLDKALDVSVSGGLCRP